MDVAAAFCAGSMDWVVGVFCAGVLAEVTPGTVGVPDTALPSACELKEAFGCLACVGPDGSRNKKGIAITPSISTPAIVSAISA